MPALIRLVCAPHYPASVRTSSPAADGAARVDPRRFVAVDECGTYTSMTRHRARALRGQRATGGCHATVERTNTTLVASMTLEGAMGEAMVVEGGTNRFVFEAYIEYFLAPTLEVGRVVLLDDLSAHKTERVRKLIKKRGEQVWFLQLTPK